MQIYVVKRGDTLWRISREYGVTVNSIVSANEIPEPNRLVVGQALVIPIIGMFYRVMPGDSFWSIGQKFGVNYIELAKINNINLNAPLRIGTRLYIPPTPKYTAEVNAYIEPRESAFLLNDATRAAPYLTYLAPFSYTVNEDGTLNDLNFYAYTEIARANNATLMMVITNIKDGAFSGELARSVLSDENVQNALLENILQKANEVGLFTDIHFDFEFIPVDLREEYTAFLRKAGEVLRPQGYLISAALAPKTSAEQKGQWYEAHDYGSIAEVVDFVVIMTYEWGYSGGPPLPVSPINLVERVLQYALTEMPASKILMGQNLYGYDWTLPYVKGGRFAQAISPQRAIEIAKNNNTQIQYDEIAQAPYFRYTTPSGEQHIVWFEDARSIQAKLNLVERLNLRGISYWKLGLPFPQNWLLVGDNFNVVKR